MPITGNPLDAPVDIAQLLARGLASAPDAPALAARDGGLSWRALDTAAANLAGNLLALGLRPGDRVASLMPNRIALLVHYLACLRAGLVGVPLNYRYMPPEIDHALEVSEAAMLLAHAERDKDLAASKLAGGLKLGRIAYGAGDGRRPSLEALIAETPARPAPPPS